MKLRTMILALILSFLCVGIGNTQDAAATAKQIIEFDVGGMKVLIKRRPGTPTVAAGLFFRGGSRNLTAENAGIESFTLKVADEGSKHFPRAVLRKESARVGTTITSGANYDYSGISLVSTKQNFDLSWRMFIDVALDPAFAAADVERIRENIINALRSATDSPEGQLERLNQRVVYAGHPYAQQPEGTIESISKLNAADLVAYHRSMLQTSRMLLVVVGDVEPDVLKARITTSFAGLSRGNYKEMPTPMLSFAKPSVEIESKPVQTDYVKGTFSAPSLGDADYYAMRAAISVLQTEVFQEVRVKRNLSYAPDAEMYASSANTAAISVSSIDPNQAVKVMLDEMRDLRERQIDDETLAGLGAYFLTTYYLKQETNAAQAGELAQYELIGGGWRNSLAFLDKIRAVTPADVQAAANKYMRNVRFSIVGNPTGIDRSIFLQK